MDQKYLRDDFNSLVAHLVEECGEVVAAAGKTQRWGWSSVNPELPPAEQETNLAWLRREMLDLQAVITRLQECIEAGRLP